MSSGLLVWFFREIWGLSLLAFAAPAFIETQLPVGARQDRRADLRVEVWLMQLCAQGENVAGWLLLPESRSPLNYFDRESDELPSSDGHVG